MIVAYLAAISAAIMWGASFLKRHEKFTMARRANAVFMARLPKRTSNPCWMKRLVISGTTAIIKIPSSAYGAESGLASGSRAGGLAGRSGGVKCAS